jgi:hypothetical protein
MAYVLSDAPTTDLIENKIAVIVTNNIPSEIISFLYLFKELASPRSDYTITIYHLGMFPYINSQNNSQTEYIYLLFQPEEVGEGNGGGVNVLVGNGGGVKVAVLGIGVLVGLGRAVGGFEVFVGSGGGTLVVGMVV